MKITIVRNKDTGIVIHAIEGHIDLEVLKVEYESIGEAFSKEDKRVHKEPEVIEA